LSRIEEDGRNWLRRPKLCIKSYRASIRRRRSTLDTSKYVVDILGVAGYIL